jgi:hypothetical protein
MNHRTQNEQVHEEHNSIMLDTGRRKRVARPGQGKYPIYAPSSAIIL